MTADIEPVAWWLIIEGPEPSRHVLNDEQEARDKAAIINSLTAHHTATVEPIYLTP